MMSILSARLGVGGRYRACPPRVPVESRYFTVVFVRVSTVTVQDSGREVSCGKERGGDGHVSPLALEGAFRNSGITSSRGSLLCRRRLTTHFNN